MTPFLSSRFHACCLSISLLFVATICTAQDSLVLTRNGKSNYCIVVASEASAVELEAANLLQSTLQQITGCRLPIATDKRKKTASEIVIGKTNRISRTDWIEETRQLKPDGYLLRTRKKQLLICGGTGKGTLYGVTGLLEDHFGYRYYAPDAQLIPNRPTLALPCLHEVNNPVSNIRIINGHFTEDNLYKAFRKLNTVEEIWNDGPWEGYFVHTFNRLVPPTTYFDTHPEYFSLINGKRVPYGQLCLSNPEVLEIALATLLEDMRAHPKVHYWSVSQNDNYDYCHCDHCRELDARFGGPSGTLLHFVNEVAHHFPDQQITTLAYQYTRQAPENIVVAPNVLVTLCTIELNRSLPIEQDPGSSSFKTDIAAWSKLCRHLMVWDYEVEFTNYLAPFPLFHTLQPNIQFFNRYGTTAHFQQCNVGKGVEFAELKSYLISQLLWDPHLNADSIIDSFMQGYYGAAAPYIRSYFDLLHQKARQSGEGLDIYGTPVWNANSFLSTDNISRYYALFDQAESAVATVPELLERVRVAKLCIQYADMEIAKTDLFGERGWYRIENGSYVLQAQRKQLLEDFYETCKRNGIVELNETGLTSAVYYQTTQRFIDVETTGNIAFQKPVSCFPAPNEKYASSGPGTLTNGVKGTEDYKINWLGWQGTDVVIDLDLQRSQTAHTITLSTLQFAKSWILHPEAVECLVSTDGNSYTSIGLLQTNRDKLQEPLIRPFTFATENTVRYIRLRITATKTLPSWHTYTGNASWLFIDEIVVK